MAKKQQPLSMFDRIVNAEGYPTPYMTRWAQTRMEEVSEAVPTSREVRSGDGLQGGGDLSQDREISVKFGTTSGTVARGDDSRLAGAVNSSRAVLTGAGLAGGGDLTADRTLSLSASGVTAGSYSMVNITVDTYGRVTSINSADAPADGTKYVRQDGAWVPA